MADKGITSCLAGRKNGKEPVAYGEVLYKGYNLVERMFGKLKDWRRIAMRYDPSTNTFMSAICIVATILFWV